MNRRVLRFGAIIGAAAVSTLAVAPVFAAATPVSQSSAQSLTLSIAGKDLVTQTKTASNDGTTETLNNASTLPDLVSLIPGNNVLKAGVAVQNAKANKDGTSYACAGLAGTGGGLVSVGQESCNLTGGPLSLDLADLNLDLGNLLGGPGAISQALNQILGGPLAQIGGALNQVIDPLTAALAGAGLDLKLSGGLSVIEASCVANPTAATGKAEILDTSGNGNIPITLSLAGTNINLLNIDTTVAAKPGGTDVLVGLDKVTDAVFQAVVTEINTVIQGQLAPLGAVVQQIVGGLVQPLIVELVKGLNPVLQALSDNLLKITINDVTPGDNGRSVKATALQVKVLGAAAQFLNGAGLVDATIGKVSCGPNRAVVPPTTPTTPANPTPTDNPKPPTVVDSGAAGNGTAATVVTATAALMLLAGSAGLIGYRRMLTK